MLLTKSLLRRLKKFRIVRIFALVGTLILLWKISYQSMPWPRSYLPTVELGPGNATLGVTIIWKHPQRKTDNVLV